MTRTFEVFFRMTTIVSVTVEAKDDEEAAETGDMVVRGDPEGADVIELVNLQFDSVEEV